MVAIVKLDEKQLEMIVKKGDRFLVSKEGEEALVKFYEAKKKFEEAEERLKELLKKEMSKLKITRVDGEKIRLIKRFFGSRFKVKDPEMAKQTGFGKVKEYVSPDVEAIEMFIEKEGKLPEGIEFNEERQEQVVINKVNEKI